MHHELVMRRSSILAASFLLASAAGARAETADEALDWHEGPRNSVTTNPLLDMFGVANLAYERAIGDRFSIQVGGLYFSPLGRSLLLLTLHPHVYVGNQPLGGLYFAPIARVGALPARALYDTSVDGGRGASVGGTVGYAWISDDVTLQLGIGGEIAWISDGKGAFGGPTADLSAGFMF